MKLHIFILSSVIATLLLCWSLESLREGPAKGNTFANTEPNRATTSLLAAIRGVGSPGFHLLYAANGSWGWGHGYYFYGGYPYYRLGFGNPYRYGDLWFPQTFRTPGYSYWRLPRHSLMMMTPNHSQHYFPAETSDHPPVPWEDR